MRAATGAYADAAVPLLSLVVLFGGPNHDDQVEEERRVKEMEKVVVAKKVLEADHVFMARRVLGPAARYAKGEESGRRRGKERRRTRTRRTGSSLTLSLSFQSCCRGGRASYFCVLKTV